MDDARQLENPSALAPVWKTGKKRRRSRWRKVLSRHLGYACLRAVHAVVCRLPWPVGRGLAWVAGTGAYFISRRDRHIALQSLTRVYGVEMPPSRVRALARESFRHAARVAVDWVILRRWPRAKVLERFPEIAEQLREVESDVKATGSGCVHMTAHCGSWEVYSLLYSHFTPGLLVPIAKRLYFKKYSDFLHRLRSETGLEMIYSDESPRRLIHALREGKMTAFLADQDLRTNSGVFVDFLGLPAYTVTFPMDLARKVGVKVFFTIMMQEGRSFRLVYPRKPWDLPNTGDEKADIHAATQLWTQMLEEEIRKSPSQWMWMHPRWRTTPENPRRQRDQQPRKSGET